jgi:parallel beta-helix repeat protein
VLWEGAAVSGYAGRVRKHSVLPLMSIFAAVGCSSGSSQSDAAAQPKAADSGTHTATQPVAADSGSRDAAEAKAADSGSRTDDPCSAEDMREPRAATTYYIAVEQAGADNAACDGLSPMDAGGGHCPFKDFTAERTLRLLDGVKSTRVEVRAGHYVIHGWDGLRVTGTGSDDSERIVLSAYGDEKPVLDVASPDGTGCMAASAPDTPECVREVVRVSGTYTAVQGLTIQNGLGYHVEVTGGAHHRLRCNVLGETVAFAMRSDCLKLDGGATDIEVQHNDFSRFRSQAIDMAQVSGVLVEDNDFHDPIDADAGATGAKFGVRDITIRNNRVHDMGGSAKMHAFALGGTGTEHPDDHSAYAVHVESNHVWNIRGLFAQVSSCADCTIEGNDVWNAGAGIHLSDSGTGRSECTSGTNGCGPSSGMLIAHNRMRAFDGGGEANQANVFVFVDPGEQSGLAVHDNLYCASAAADARFGFGGELLGFDAWSVAIGSDANSSVLASSDAQCKAF